jgi:hypothetical protein
MKNINIIINPTANIEVKGILDSSPKNIQKIFHTLSDFLFSLYFLIPIKNPTVRIIIIKIGINSGIANMATITSEYAKSSNIPNVNIDKINVLKFATK